jgi:quercetin dioxygenase-like cupin family protein
MKILSLLILASIPLIVSAQNTNYTISSFLTQGPQAPNTHYIGEAWLNSVIQADAEINYNITKATFRANSTLDWHKHSAPQVLIVVDGEGYCQERGKEAVIIKKGDVIRCNKDIEHWHTSSKENAVTYLAIYGGAQPTTWTEKLTQEYYDGIAEKLKAQKK